MFITALNVICTGRIMKSINFTIALTTLLFFFSQAKPVLADGNFAVKAGVTQIDAPEYDLATNLGLTIGSNLVKRDSFRLSLEIELTTTIIEGSTSTALEEWEMDTLALYTTLRQRGDHYLKLRGGYLDRQIRYDSGISNTDAGFSWGIGYGFRLNKKRFLEIEYTAMGDHNAADINYLSIAYLF